jgi:hypothetical protein
VGWPSAEVLKGEPLCGHGMAYGLGNVAGDCLAVDLVFIESEHREALK